MAYKNPQASIRNEAMNAPQPLDYETPKPAPLAARTEVRVLAAALFALGLVGLGVGGTILFSAPTLGALCLVPIVFFVYVTGNVAFWGRWGVKVTEQSFPRDTDRGV